MFGLSLVGIISKRQFQVKVLALGFPLVDHIFRTFLFFWQELVFLRTKEAIVRFDGE